MLIDTSFDFRNDAGMTKKRKQRDPDIHSLNLRRYHKMLWSKMLPNGHYLNLDDSLSKAKLYLTHKSNIGDFRLNSDAFIPTYIGHKGMDNILEKFAEREHDEFSAISYTIGGMIIWPGNKIQNKMTINGARGCRKSTIGDRFDITLECIRLYYLGLDNILDDVFQRYRSFFDLFETFDGYVDFFLLQDLVSSDYKSVRFFTPSYTFNQHPRPNDVDSYAHYRTCSINFIEARNRRINKYVSELR